MAAIDGKVERGVRCSMRSRTGQSACAARYLNGAARRGRGSPARLSACRRTCARERSPFATPTPRHAAAHQLGYGKLQPARTTLCRPTRASPAMRTSHAFLLGCQRWPARRRQGVRVGAGKRARQGHGECARAARRLSGASGSAGVGSWRCTVDSSRPGRARTAWPRLSAAQHRRRAPRALGALVPRGARAAVTHGADRVRSALGTCCASPFTLQRTRGRRRAGGPAFWRASAAAPFRRPARGGRSGVAEQPQNGQI